MIQEELERLQYLYDKELPMSELKEYTQIKTQKEMTLRGKVYAFGWSSGLIIPASLVTFEGTNIYVKTWWIEKNRKELENKWFIEIIE